uniref:hypothetical protein n=1 Tax=Aliarcobacter sp. TaxID=2321116 RepID=UPI0040485E41
MTNQAEVIIGLIIAFGIFYWVAFLTRNERMGFGKNLDIEAFANSKTKTKKSFDIDNFFYSIGSFIIGTLKVVGVLVLIGLIIWAIVAFPIAAIIILLILILLK